MTEQALVEAANRVTRLVPTYGGNVQAAAILLLADQLKRIADLIESASKG